MKPECVALVVSCGRPRLINPHRFDPYAVVPLIAESLIKLGQLRSDVFVKFYIRTIYCHTRDQVNKGRAKDEFSKLVIQ